MEKLIIVNIDLLKMVNDIADNKIHIELLDAIHKIIYHINDKNITDVIIFKNDVPIELPKHAISEFKTSELNLLEFNNFYRYFKLNQLKKELL